MAGYGSMTPLGSFMAHVVFGLITGAIYGLHCCSTTPPRRRRQPLLPDPEHLPALDTDSGNAQSRGVLG